MTDEDINKLMRTLGQIVDQIVQSITASLQKMFPAPFPGVTEAAEAFENLSKLALSSRGYRKAVRWDEKNRRRQLKGLVEKPCPYQKADGERREENG